MPVDETLVSNAEKAEKRYGLPKDIYIKYCQLFSWSSQHSRFLMADAPIAVKLDSGFGMGFIVGYLAAQKNEKALVELFKT